MAIIYTYPYDNDIQDNDAWVGTNRPNRKTKQYTALALSNYLNTHGRISIAGQMTYKFDEATYAGNGTISLLSGGESTFASITDLIISDIDLSGQNVVDFVNYLVGQTILIVQQNQIGNFGYYTVNSYSVAPVTDYHVFNLSVINSNGSIVDQEYYDIASFFASASGGDKHYTFTQIAAASTWNITHNLKKKPSVSIVDSAENNVYGDIEYINENQLTITFNSAFSGKAYLN
jgi:hypothetical protein